MFKVIHSPQFTHVVPIQVPVDGGHAEETMRVRYTVVEAEAAELRTPEQIEAFLRGAVVHISDLVGPDGETVEWNDQVRDSLFALPYVRIGLVSGYFRAILKAKPGN